MNAIPGARKDVVPIACTIKLSHISCSFATRLGSSAFFGSLPVNLSQRHPAPSLIKVCKSLKIEALQIPIM